MFWICFKNKVVPSESSSYINKRENENEIETIINSLEVFISEIFLRKKLQIFAADYLSIKLLTGKIEQLSKDFIEEERKFYTTRKNRLVREFFHEVNFYHRRKEIFIEESLFIDKSFYLQLKNYPVNLRLKCSE